jgi:hypothetical protein
LPDYRKFEKAGEEIVRENLALGRYGDVNGRNARAWLASKDRENAKVKDGESKALANDQVAIARDARDASVRSASAAEASAAEAKNANIISTLALVLAVVAIAVAVLSAFLK